MVSVKTEVVTVSKRKYTTGTYCTGTTCICVLTCTPYFLNIIVHFLSLVIACIMKLAPSFIKDYMHETRLHIYTCMTAE